MTLRSRAVDVVFGALEGVAALYDLVRDLRRPQKPQALSYRDVERQQSQIRSATRRDAIRPPPSSRD